MGLVGEIGFYVVDGGFRLGDVVGVVRWYGLSGIVVVGCLGFLDLWGRVVREKGFVVVLVGASKIGGVGSGRLASVSGRN